MTTENLAYKPGLEGVIAAETRRSYVNGQTGTLLIAGYPLADIAARATFEEVVYLLWLDRLPTAVELDDFKKQLAALRPLPAATLTLLHAIADSGVPVMDALRMATGTLSLGVDETDASALAMALVARFPTIVAAYWRLSHGQEPVAPTTDLGHAANYLYMLKGERPSPAQARAMATYLNTVSDHGLNASTFTARVIVSTQSDLVSAITGAVGALKGPLHGGAPG
ncbi:MAG: citrate synthase, partial [Anaerolineales bacterium]|nr:citrate synthase [Anaerolineales bacterium]